MLKLGQYKYSKSAIRRFTFAINYIRQELKTGRDIWASLFSAGITFSDDVEAFKNFAYFNNAKDISEKLIK